MMVNLLLEIPEELIAVLIDHTNDRADVMSFVDFISEFIDVERIDIMFKNICFEKYPLITTQLSEMIIDRTSINPYKYTSYVSLYQILMIHNVVGENNSKLQLNIEDIDSSEGINYIPTLYYMYGFYKKFPHVYKKLIPLNSEVDHILLNWDLLYHLSINRLMKFIQGEYGQIDYLYRETGILSRSNWKEILKVLISNEEIKHILKNESPDYEMYMIIKNGKLNKIFKFIYKNIGLNKEDMLIAAIRRNNWELFKWMFIRDEDKFRGNTSFQRRFYALKNENITDFDNYKDVMTGYIKLT
jgi:hypothetical protein